MVAGLGDPFAIVAIEATDRFAHMFGWTAPASQSGGASFHELPSRLIDIRGRNVARAMHESIEVGPPDVRFLWRDLDSTPLEVAEGPMLEQIG